jgi:hypothetical protein
MESCRKGKVMDFLLYLWTFWWDWWPAVAAGAYLGLDDAARAWFPSVEARLDKVPGWWRRRIAISVLVGTVFYAGFVAWHQERIGRLAAEKQLSQLQTNKADLIYTRLVLHRYPGEDISRVDLYQSNKGTLPEYAPVARITYKLPTRILDQKEVNEELESISRIIQKAPYDLENRDTLAVGHEGFSTVPDLALTDEQIKKFNAGEFAIYVFAGSIYTDDATPSGKVRGPLACIYVTRTFDYQHGCASRRYLWDSARNLAPK